MISKVTAQSGSYQYEFELSASAESGALIFDVTGIAEHSREITVDKLATRTMISAIAPTQRTITLTIRILDVNVERERSILRRVFAEGNNVLLTFETDLVAVRTIQGTVESCNNPIFVKESLMTVTIICPDALFYGERIDTLLAGDLGELTNHGEVESGCYISMILDGTVKTGTATISNAAGNLMSFDMAKVDTLVGGILNGDIIVIDSRHKKRCVLIRGEITTNIFSAIKLPYAWMQINPGTNNFTVAGFGGVISVAYYPAYGGM